MFSHTRERTDGRNKAINILIVTLDSHSRFDSRLRLMKCRRQSGSLILNLINKELLLFLRIHDFMDKSVVLTEF